MLVPVTLYFEAILILAEPWGQARANHLAAPYLALSVATQVPLIAAAQLGQPQMCPRGQCHLHPEPL